MLKIGDFSKLSMVSVKTLRYYDELGLLKPARVDEFTGYRYYSASQMPRLNRILALKDLGLSLGQVASMLDEGLSAAEIRGILRFRLSETEQRLSEERALLGRVEARLAQIEREGRLPVYDVALKQYPDCAVAYVRRILPRYSELSQMFGELFSNVGPAGAIPIGPPCSIYHDHEFKETDADVEVAVPVSGEIRGDGPVRTRLLPGGNMACVVHHGPYETIGQAYTAVMAWIEPNGYRINGPVRELYLTDPAETPDPKDNVTEIQVPVEKA